MNLAQRFYILLDVDPLTLTRHTLGKSVTATKRGPGRRYAWGKAHRTEGDLKPGTRRLRRGADSIRHDEQVRELLIARDNATRYAVI